ncbi:MAG TPA: hypothetical protein VHZ52_09425 [Acidobacteriaceae bacterium]|nr:hypothetical protein [Acidobacteriaceae bacterium]
MLRAVSTAALLPLLVFPTAILAQQKTHKPISLARLEVSSEVAATTRQGQPAVLRITLKNVGNISVDLPMPNSGCTNEDGSVIVRLVWSSSDPDDHTGFGEACGGGVTDCPSLMDRARDEWVHLLPGEFLTFNENIHTRTARWKPGNVEYWVTYDPPRLNVKDISELQAAGFIVPDEKLTTDHKTFPIH